MEFVPAKTIVSGWKSGEDWFGINYNMNIYRGCAHGCIYCDSRSECYHVERFDEVRIKENALVVIENDLRSKRKNGVVGTGAMSDPYNPFEAEYGLTRGALKLLDDYRFGASIATKSDLVTRDIDLLRRIHSHSPVLVMVTVTTCDDDLCGKLEPDAPVASRRFEAIRALSESGIPAGVLLMPVLPFIEDTDENIAGIIAKAGECGARFIYPGLGVTLRQNQRDWFYDKLDLLFPGMRQRYIRQYGDKYSCQSPRAKELWQLIHTECGQRGILFRMPEIIAAYKHGYGDGQLSLF